MNTNPFTNKPHCSLYIVRHGQTDWNLEKRLQGHQDIPLNNTGTTQAKDTANLLKDIKFDAAYSSDLLRAKQTADIIVLEHNLIVKTTKLLRERNFGHLEGKITTEIRHELDKYDFVPDEQKATYKGGLDIESDDEISTRFITLIREIAVSHMNQNILVASHGGIIRAFLIRIGFGTYKNFGHAAINNASYIHLLSDGIDFHIANTFNIDLPK